MSARRSQRIASRRKRLSQARVRSTTQRCRPSLSLVSTPRLAIRGWTERAGYSARQRRWSWALSAWTLKASAGPPPSAPDSRHRIAGGRQHQTVAPVSWAQAHPERRAPAVDHKIALRARSGAIRRVRTGFSTPVLAAAEALSKLIRLQSRYPAPDKRSSSPRCSATQTLACCQARNRRKQVMPEQPTSRGSISHGMPELSTKTTPASARRWRTGVGHPWAWLAHPEATAQWPPRVRREPGGSSCPLNTLDAVLLGALRGTRGSSCACHEFLDRRL